MNTYLTAKDIEEMAARGIRQLELQPREFLTDFARETMRQLNIELVRKQKQGVVFADQTRSKQREMLTDYNKPAGCQRGAGTPAVQRPTQNTSFSQPETSSNSSAVNRLVDLMSKAISRGG